MTATSEIFLNQRPAPDTTARPDPTRTVNPALAQAYGPEIMASAARLLGGLDREAHSISHGSFDRVNWGWKFRDHPLGMLQLSSYPLALLWKHDLPDNPFRGNERLREWIIAACEETVSRQHRNGAFSAFVPNEQDPMSTLSMIFGLCETLLAMGEAIPDGVRERVLESVRRACRFCAGKEESHGFVSNHWALFAVAWQGAHELLGDDSHRAEAEGVIDRILAAQSPEGWYREYDGPDPGYETFGIFYLSLYWRRTGCERTLASLDRSVEFQAHGIQPDGRIGGVYGSRHASLYMPGGFEILAAELPMAAAVARFMRARLGRRNVVTPATSDAQNLTPLLYGHVEACFAHPSDHHELPALPCERDDLDREFAEAGWRVVSSKRYYAVLNASKGGVCRIFDKEGDRVAYRDAGYLVRAGRRKWTSQIIGLGRIEPTDDEAETACRTDLAEVQQQMPTPFKILALRSLNLTLFRSPRVGNWLRKQIATRLIMSKKPGPLSLRRRVRFTSDRIDFEDRLERTGSLRVDEVALPRSFMAIHMGSAKYFHPSELEATPLVPVAGMAEALNREGAAERAFTVAFPEGAPARLDVREG